MKKLLFIFTFACISVINAQWNPNTSQNLLVTDPGAGANAFADTTNDGKTYIGYWKKVAAPTNYELWLQILDQNGNKILGTDGILLSNQIPMGSYTFVQKTVVDSSNNIYIAVTGTGTGTPAYIFKVTPQGNSVWAGGLNLGEGYVPTVLPLSNGDVLISHWPASQKFVKVQRYNSNGQPVWPSATTIMSDTTTNNTAPADLFEFSDGEIEIIFHKITTGAISYLFAQKLTASGALIWSTPKQITTKTTTWSGKYGGAVDGKSVYYGFTSGQGGWNHGYLQKISSDGSLPWGVDGSDFDNTFTYRQNDMKIAFTPGSQYIWSIANYTPGSQGTLSGEFVQKFDKVTGARLFTDTAKQVFPVDDNYSLHQGALSLADDKPYFVVSRKLGSSNINNSLNAVSLDNNGNFVWSQQSVPMATYSATKSYVTALRPVNGQSVIVFQELKSGDTNSSVYAQNLTFSVLSANDVALNKSQISVYPNPAKDFLYMNGIKDSEKVSIYSISGQLVKSENPDKGKINVQNLESGVYVLKIKDQPKGFKFIKK